MTFFEFVCIKGEGKNLEEIITQDDSDLLADIIWWIKGYHRAFKDAEETCDFKEDHVRALEKAKRRFQEYLEKKEK